ncbi:protein GLUTAMINE DUMPER 3-like [Lolium rigidum]|uniref:protein GLUTAMINE DUMPER 3-like n=1 Tax=Lolium rigidum TaxID=89674 RepID=UPI001F5C65DF|nr:protein GLUTAMINE DUMPER 3-like [Lolium rigidum]
MRSIAAPAATPTAAVSPWHSPVPYLFGGLAAMIGLIALALLILACSYWKLNNILGTGSTSSSGAGATDGAGSKSPAGAAAASPAVFTDLVAVVMAGETVPTFLAAPIVRRAVANDAADGEGSLETEDEKNRGKSGVVRSRQLVVTD